MKADTRLTSKGQVVIPKAIRARIHWHKGMELHVEASEEDRTVLLRPQFPAPADINALLDEVCGFISEGDPLAELEAEHQAEVEADECWRRSRR